MSIKTETHVNDPDRTHPSCHIMATIPGVHVYSFESHLNTLVTSIRQMATHGNYYDKYRPHIALQFHRIVFVDSPT